MLEILLIFVVILYLIGIYITWLIYLRIENYNIIIIYNYMDYSVLWMEKIFMFKYWYWKDKLDILKNKKSLLLNLRDIKIWKVRNDLILFIR